MFKGFFVFVNLKGIKTQEFLNKHIAIYISNKDDKRKLVDDIKTKVLIGDLSNLKGALFSDIALNKFILEETRHGHFDVTTSLVKPYNC